MAYSLDLPPQFANNGWKVKIRDKERLETPHVTITKGRDTWRYSLRNDEFLDREPPPSDIDKKLMQIIRASYAELQARWDAIYPENPIQSQDDP